MVTDKKNQHYIPKFYLRNFSYQSNKKQIGVFNLHKQFFYQTGKLKTQGSKNFYYGMDGKIEDELSNIETTLAITIKKIIDTQQLPKRETIDYINILIFIILTDLRNPVRVEGGKNMIVALREKILSLDPNADLEKLFPLPSHEENIQLILSLVPELIMMIIDLDYKLIINNTVIPFITSDFPIVKYNQFLERKNWFGTKSGYGNVGLQIFFAINHSTALIFFDSAIYKVGNKKDKVVKLNFEKDINQFNLLQFLNCFETIFFDEKVKKDYLHNLFEKSKKYKKANKTTSKLSYIIEEKNGIEDVGMLQKENLIILGSTDCEVNLDISFIKIHSKGKSFKLNNTVAQLRKHPEKLHKNNRGLL